MQLLLLVIMFIQVNLLSIWCETYIYKAKSYEEIAIAIYKEVFR